MIFDALVVGGGPAGATTALLLAKAGWSVALVEKQQFPRRKVCGEFISATSLPLLQQLGIADFYVKHSGPSVLQVGIFAGDAVLVSAMPAAYDSSSQWGRALGREQLDDVLLAQAVRAGVTVWQPWLVKTLQRSGGLFAVNLAAGTEIKSLSARLVVMAQGSWERGVVSTLEAKHKRSDLLAFKAHFIHSSLAHGLMPLLAFPGGYGGMVQSDSGRVTLSCCIRRDTLAAVRKKFVGVTAGEAVLQHITAHCLGVRQVLAGAERQGKWLSAGPIRPGIRSRYREGVFFVGNSAGEAHPIVAEGISMAMQSAWLLAETLLAELDVDVAGRIYAKQWQRCFAKRIQAAAVFSTIALRPWAVGLVLPILKMFPAVLTWGAKLSGKITQVVPVSLDKAAIASETGNAI